MSSSGRSTSRLEVLFTQHCSNPCSHSTAAIRYAPWSKNDGILENVGTGTRTCAHAHTDTYGKDGQLLFRNYHNIKTYVDLCIMLEMRRSNTANNANKENLITVKIDFYEPLLNQGSTIKSQGTRWFYHS